MIHACNINIFVLRKTLSHLCVSRMQLLELVEIILDDNQTGVVHS